MVNLPWWSRVRRNPSYDNNTPPSHALLCSGYASCLGLCSSTSTSRWKLHKPTHRHRGTKAALTPRSCPAVQVLGTANSVALWFAAPIVTRRGRTDPSQVEQALCWIYGKGTSWEQHLLSVTGMQPSHPNGYFLRRDIATCCRASGSQLSWLEQRWASPELEGWILMEVVSVNCS